MLTLTAKQSESVHSILNYYHPEVVEAMQKVIDTAHDLTELQIVSDLLRGTLEHLLESATRPTEDHL